jgi:hypothetical protein
MKRLHRERKDLSDMRYAAIVKDGITRGLERMKIQISGEQ